MVPFCSNLGAVTESAKAKVPPPRQPRAFERTGFWVSLLLAVGFITGGGLGAAENHLEEVPAIVKTWLNAQTNIQTWTAEVTQIRALKTLTQPLKAAGRVWFTAPNQFRWEIGNPAQTIALRKS